MPFNWEPGRQGTGYEKLKLWVKLKYFGRYKWDAYILRYPEGSKIPSHTDPLPEHAHYRLNIYLLNAKAGGVPEHDKAIVSNRFFTLFRPDLYEHSVSEITRGSRYVLSLGFCRRIK